MDQAAIGFTRHVSHLVQPTGHAQQGSLELSILPFHSRPSAWTAGAAREPAGSPPCLPLGCVACRLVCSKDVHTICRHSGTRRAGPLPASEETNNVLSAAHASIASHDLVRGRTFTLPGVAMLLSHAVESSLSSQRKVEQVEGACIEVYRRAHFQ